MYFIFIYMKSEVTRKKKSYRELMKEFYWPDNFSDYDLPKNSKLNKLVYKSYIINLKKDKFKLNRFMKNKNHKKFKDDFTVIEAIDGKKLRKEEVSLDEVKLTYQWIEYFKCSNDPILKELRINPEVLMSSAEVGICMSHLKCWNDFLQNGKKGEYALIIEDDSVFCDDFENKLKLILDSIKKNKNHMIYLGYLPDQHSFEIKEFNDFMYEVKNGIWFLSSYIISWEGVKKLLSRLPIFGPVDMWIQLQFDFLNPIVTKKFLCIQEDFTKSSNTYSFFSKLHNPFNNTNQVSWWIKKSYIFNDLEWIRQFKNLYSETDILIKSIDAVIKNHKYINKKLWKAFKNLKKELTTGEIQ